jgi:TatD DNase family protein
MLTDAHCHPSDLKELFPTAEDQRRQLGVMCASSATTIEEFEYCEGLSRQAKTDTAAPLLPCFAIHPQMPTLGIRDRGSGIGELRKSNEQLAMSNARIRDMGLGVLETLASEGRLAGVGETGFDLYNATFRETEKIQDWLFAGHLETALRYDLPLVIHVRRAMHKIFANSRALKKCRAVIFHSWSGTVGEGEALLRRGINVFFSFGTAIMLNHREMMRCCAVFPANRLLTETDAPFQPLRGKKISCYADLERILETAAALRREAGSEFSSVRELEKIVEDNFRSVFLQIYSVPKLRTE